MDYNGLERSYIPLEMFQNAVFDSYRQKEIICFIYFFSNNLFIQGCSRLLL